MGRSRFGGSAGLDLFPGSSSEKVFDHGPFNQYPGIKDFLGKYQAQAQAAGVDLLGFYLPPFAYSAMQIYEQTINAVKSTDNAKMAEYAHKNTFKTIVGDIAFGGNGEWAESRLLFVQYQGIVGNDINQFKEVGKQVILTPAQYKSGTFKYPYKG